GAGGAQHRGVDRDWRLDAERGLLQIELEAQDRVGARPGARPRAPRRGRAKERVHDVLEADERAASARTGRPGPRAERGAAEVDDLALLRVGQHLVSGIDVLELLLGRRVRVNVGVKFARQPAVGALDLVW